MLSYFINFFVKEFLSSIKNMLLLDKVADECANGKGQKHCLVAEKFAADNQANDKCNHWIPKAKLSFMFSQINIPSNNHAGKQHNKNRKHFAACNKVEKEAKEQTTKCDIIHPIINQIYCCFFVHFLFPFYSLFYFI